MFQVVLADEAVRSLVDPWDLSEEIARTLLAGAQSPPRSAVTPGASWFAPMVAADSEIISVKMVGVYPENKRAGLPLVRAVTAVYSSVTGEPLLLYEANIATALRTAAASLLAARILGARTGGVLGIIGAGVQGLWHGLVLGDALGPSRILVHDRNPDKAEKLAGTLGGEPAGLEEVNQKSSILVAATTSREPVVLGGLLREGAIVLSVGAPAPVRELDDEVKRRGRCLLADTVEGVRSESPDAEGWEEIIGLADALRGAECKRGDIAVYKSVGTSLFDLAISRYIIRRLGLRP